MYAPSSPVTRVTSPVRGSTRNTGRRPPSSAAKYTVRESGDQAGSTGHRSRPGSRSRPASPSGPAPLTPSTTRVRSGGRSGVVCVSRWQTMNRPSGETRGASKLYSGALSSTRRFPVATSIMTSSACDCPAGCHSCHPVITEVPSGVSSNASSSRARPGSGVRSRIPVKSSPGPAASLSRSGSTANSRTWSGPRSWSQYLTGADSCKMAVTPASPRSFATGRRPRRCSRRLRRDPRPAAPASSARRSRRPWPPRRP